MDRPSSGLQSKKNVWFIIKECHIMRIFYEMNKSTQKDETGKDSG